MRSRATVIKSSVAFAILICTLVVGDRAHAQSLDFEVVMPNGTAAPPDSTVVAQLVFTNTGTIQLSAVSAGTSWLFGGAENLVPVYSIVPLSSPGACDVYYDTLVPPPGSPTPGEVSASIIPPERSLSQGEQVGCEVGIYIWPDTRGVFEVRLLAGSAEITESVETTFMLEAWLRKIPTTSTASLLFLLLMICGLSVRQLRSG